MIDTGHSINEIWQWIPGTREQCVYFSMLEGATSEREERRAQFPRIRRFLEDVWRTIQYFWRDRGRGEQINSYSPLFEGDWNHISRQIGSTIRSFKGEDRMGPADFSQTNLPRHDYLVQLQQALQGVFRHHRIVSSRFMFQLKRILPVAFIMSLVAFICNYVALATITALLAAFPFLYTVGVGVLLAYKKEAAARSYWVASLYGEWS
jgi:hypothetical protein